MKSCHDHVCVRFVAALFPVLLAPILGLTQSPARTASASRLSKTAEAIEITHCLKVGDPDSLSDNPALDRAKWLHARKIMRGPKVWLPLKAVLRPMPQVTCSSY
jgi:hypothetical protein